MLRHLQNSQELIFLASLSAAAGYLSRLVPAFYVPILLIRLGVFSYCFWVLFRAERQKELAILIGTALTLGLLGSHLDILEIEFRYNLPDLVAKITACVVFIAVVLTLLKALRR